jgi:hypothetical protein
MGLSRTPPTPSHRSTTTATTSRTASPSRSAGSPTRAWRRRSPGASTTSPCSSARPGGPSRNVAPCVLASRQEPLPPAPRRGASRSTFRKRPTSGLTAPGRPRLRVARHLPKPAPRSAEWAPRRFKRRGSAGDTSSAMRVAPTTNQYPKAEHQRAAEDRCAAARRQHVASCHRLAAGRCGG